MMHRRADPVRRQGPERQGIKARRAVQNLKRKPTVVHADSAPHGAAWSSRCRAGTTSVAPDASARVDRRPRPRRSPQAVAKGLLTGLVYGLMALGLSVIFGVMRVVNFAHGEMMVVGMYSPATVLFALSRGLDPSLMPAGRSRRCSSSSGYALQRGADLARSSAGPSTQQFMLLLAVAHPAWSTRCLAIARARLRAACRSTTQLESYELGPLRVRRRAPACRRRRRRRSPACFGCSSRCTLHRQGDPRLPPTTTSARLVVGLDVQQPLRPHLRRRRRLRRRVAGCAHDHHSSTVDALPRPATTRCSPSSSSIVGGLGSHDRRAAGRRADRRLRRRSRACCSRPRSKSMFSFGLLILVLLFRAAGPARRKQRVSMRAAAALDAPRAHSGAWPSARAALLVAPACSASTALSVADR